MQKRHFQHAADMVKAILAGEWSDSPPEWSATIPAGEVDAGYARCAAVDSYTRAVQTAEAFIILFSAFNPLFDSKRFLIACGLVEAPAKVKRGR